MPSRGSLERHPLLRCDSKSNHLDRRTRPPWRSTALRCVSHCVATIIRRPVFDNLRHCAYGRSLVAWPVRASPGKARRGKTRRGEASEGAREKSRASLSFVLGQKNPARRSCPRTPWGVSNSIVVPEANPLYLAGKRDRYWSKFPVSFPPVFPRLPVNHGPREQRHWSVVPR
jgi:hypothetical protein